MNLWITKNMLKINKNQQIKKRGKEVRKKKVSGAFLK